MTIFGKEDSYQREQQPKDPGLEGALVSLRKRKIGWWELGEGGDWRWLGPRLQEGA